MKKLCLLGASGSIGLNVCKIVEDYQDDFELVSIAINNRIEILEEIICKHPSIKYIAISNQEKAKEFKLLHPEYNVLSSDNCLIELIDASKVDMVVNALVGIIGLKPTLHTLSKGIDCALANKESLVVGGELINNLLKTTTAKLYPIDSEHVALSKLLKNHLDDVEELVITASGGSFRDLDISELENVSIQSALNHPSWKMGDKITIDSATMMNKGFEIIEAHYLFNFPLEKIKVLIHDESIIHSLVRMKDGSLHADLGVPDMRIPIFYALNQEQYRNLNVEHLSLEKIQSLHFRKLDLNRYPCLELALKALNMGGSMLIVLNSSNDVANKLFLEGKIKFTDIAKIISYMMDKHQIINKPTVEDVISISKWVEEEIMKLLNMGEKLC